MENLWPTPQLCRGHKTVLQSKDLKKIIKNTRGKNRRKDGREEGKAREKEERISISGDAGGAVGRKPSKEKILNSNKKY